jgi:hypothetical protein
VGFADGHARLTRRLRQLIGVDCQSMLTSHAAVRHGVSWSKARRAEKAFLLVHQSERQPEPHLDLAVRADGRCYAACSRVADAGVWQVKLR